MRNIRFNESVSMNYPNLPRMSRLALKYLLAFACVVFFSINVISLLGYMRSLIPANESIDTGTEFSIDQPTGSRQRVPRTNVFFLKIQRTGSSTAQNILYRLSLRHSLDVVLPETTNVIAYDRPIDDRSLSERLTPVNGKFNIFACQSRYHPDNYKVMYSDTLRVTLLRDPVSYFQSYYNFFNDTDSLRVRSNGITFGQFVSSLSSTQPLNVRRSNRLQKGANQMCLELGLDNADNPDETTIRDFIDYIDGEFDFVMISEYYEECLILLADLMGWPLSYVAYLSPAVIQPSLAPKINLTQTDINNLRKLNSADSQLYDHFVKALGRRVRQYGAERMLSNLRVLEKLNDDLRRKCVSREIRDSSSGAISYELKPNAEWECIYAAKSEMNFIDELREKQIRRCKEEKQIFNLIRSKGNNVF